MLEEGKDGNNKEPTESGPEGLLMERRSQDQRNSPLGTFHHTERERLYMDSLGLLLPKVWQHALQLLQHIPEPAAPLG